MAGQWLSDQSKSGRESRRLIALLQDTGTARLAGVLPALAHADLSVRKRFLRDLLASDTAVAPYHLTPHGFSVALSQINADDATELFHRVIVPSIAESSSAAVVRAGLSLMQRWSIASTLGVDESTRLAMQWAARLGKEPDSGMAEALSSAIALVAPSVSADDASLIVKDLTPRLLIAPTEDMRIAIAPALRSLAARLAPDAATAFAEDVANSLAEDAPAESVEVLAAAVNGALAQVPPTKAAAIAHRLTERMATENEPGSLGAMAMMLGGLSQLDRHAADALLQTLMTRLTDESQDNLLVALQPGTAAVLKRASQDARDRFHNRLIERLPRETAQRIVPLSLILAGMGESEPPGAIVEQAKSEESGESLVALTAYLGAITPDQPHPRLEELARVLGARIAAESDPVHIATWAVALNNLKGRIGPATAEALAEPIVARMSAESDRDAMLQLAAALQTLGPAVLSVAADRLASHVIDRIQPRASVGEWRLLAFAAASFENAKADALGRAARQIAARMTVETDTVALRRLANGLYALGKASAEAWPVAAESLVARIRDATEASSAFDLAQTLAALAEEIADDDGNEFPTAAASALMGHALASSDPMAVRIFANGVEALREAVTDNASRDWAGSITHRMPQETSLDLKLAFGDLLGKLPDNSIPADALLGNGWLQLYDADCTAALRVVRVARDQAISLQLQNPLCTEQSWTSLASVLLATNRKSDNDAEAVASANRDDPSEDGDDDEDLADFHQLILQDDDGLVDMPSSPNSEEIDLVRLSAALPHSAFNRQLGAASLLAIASCLIGVSLLVASLAARGETRFPV
jgi:hypothetical protein